MVTAVGFIYNPSAGPVLQRVLVPAASFFPRPLESTLYPICSLRAAGSIQNGQKEHAGYRGTDIEGSMGLYQSTVFVKILVLDTGGHPKAPLSVALQTWDGLWGQ